MPKQSLIKKLLERRVPQIIGSYFIASTSMILFLDWLKINYAFPKEYITLALFGALAILPSVIILAYFHGAPGKDEWTKIEKIGVPINIIFIFSILLIGYNSDWWFEQLPELPITKVELDADKTRILIPYLGSRNELVKIINADKIKSNWIRKHGKGSENPSNYSMIPFTLEETNKLYNELVTKINTTFFPDNIIYSAEDIERAFEKKAKNPPDFSTFPTEVENQLLADSIKKDVFKPFNYFVPDTLNKIIDIVDDNEYANQLILIINGYNIIPPFGYIEKTAFVDVLFRRVHNIHRNDEGVLDKTVATSSLMEGIQSNKERFIPDIIDLINRVIQRYSNDEFIAEIKSIDEDKVFIKIKTEKKLLKNMELSVMRQYQYQDSISIQNRINHIKEFIECCDNHSQDKDCLNFHAIEMWDQTEYDRLISKKHHLQSGQGLNQMGLNKIILINEVYDSIAVGNVVKNPNTCVKLLPGDLLKLNK